MFWNLNLSQWNKYFAVRLFLEEYQQDFGTTLTPDYIAQVYGISTKLLKITIHWRIKIPKVISLPTFCSNDF